MEDPKWLKFMTIGLVLAALAVGYFLFTSRFSSSTVKTNPQVSQATSSASPSATPKTTVLGQNSKTLSSPDSAVAESPASAYTRIVNRTQSNGSTVSTLPNTGFPVPVIAILTASIMISGWGLRKFPH